MDSLFAAPLFIGDGPSETLDLSATPFFVNEAGTPHYVKEVPASAHLIQPAPYDPDVVRGYDHVVLDRGEGKAGDYGVTTQLEFAGNSVAYEPLWATRDNAAAFGITLVERGQAIRIEAPIEPPLPGKAAHTRANIYEYGVFAGHACPYLPHELDAPPKLLPIICTDLECHGFAHIFASVDHRLPLVISVGRYWPDRQCIRLADLWVPPGHALYIPPMSAAADRPCLDLHNNRNSARAGWGSYDHLSITTHTMLDENRGIFWYWNALPTAHGDPRLKGAAAS